MKGSILFASFAVLLLQLSASPAQLQPPKARIEGVVVKAGTGEAVNGARVTLTRMAGRGAAPLSAPPPQSPATPAASARGAVTPPKPILPVVTADQGKFAFQDLDEGPYTLQILANGYVSLNYGQRYTGGPGTTITLTQGQDLKDLAITLIPASNISGRIRDRSDQPLVNVPIQLMRYSYDVQGQRTYQTVGSAKTNDRGEYRIYWITPGRYFLMAGNAVTSANPMLAMMTAMMGGDSASANAVPLTMGYSFYPGVTDIGSARSIDLQPGAELDSMNMTMTPRPATYRIRGRIVDSRTGQPPAKARVLASSRTPGMSSNGILDQMAMELPINNYNSADGSFEIRDVLQGAYMVTAIVQNPPIAGAGVRVGPPQAQGTSSGITTIAVGDSDVEGVAITVFPAAAIAGRIRSDSQQQLPATPDRMRVQLMPRNPSPSPQGASGVLTSMPGADGTFRFATNVPIGEYRLTLQALVGGRGGPGGTVYLKEARLDGMDVLNAPLRVSGPVSGMLDLVVGATNGQVLGTVTDRRTQPVSVTQVVLIPDRARDRIDLYKTVNTDENGRFAFTGIVPGDYRVFSWEGVEPYSWFDPDLMLQSETMGRAVHVTDTSLDMIDVKLIPREGPQ